MNLDLRNLLTAGLLGGLVLPALGLAQETVRTLTPLERANRTFAAADMNRDGKVDLGEATKASIPRSAMTSWDEDTSRSLSKDEFLRYYRQLMVNAGQKPGAGLDKEVKRIDAAKKTREEQEARRRLRGEQDSSKASTAGESTAEKYKRAQAALKDRMTRAGAQSGAAKGEQARLAERARSASLTTKTSGQSVGAGGTARDRLARAQAALENRARSAGASRDQLARAQAGLEARAKDGLGAGANEGGSSGAEVQTGAQLKSKLDRANGALVERAQAGDMTREQQQAMKQKLEERARNAASGGAPSGNAPAPQPTSKVDRAGVRSSQKTSTTTRAQELAGIPSGDRQKVSRALDAMEQRAKSGNWSREKLATEKQQLLDRAKGAQRAGGVAGGETTEQRKQREARKRAAGANQQPDRGAKPAGSRPAKPANGDSRKNSARAGEKKKVAPAKKAAPVKKTGGTRPAKKPDASTSGRTRRDS